MIEKPRRQRSGARLQVALARSSTKSSSPPAPLKAVTLRDSGKSSTKKAAPAATPASTGLDISGKTGTVQVIAQHGWVEDTSGLPFKYRDHAWFASFAPRENPQLVVVVFVEHGGHGGVDAAPLAKLLYESRFRPAGAADAISTLTDPETLEKIKEGRAADARRSQDLRPRSPARLLTRIVPAT